MRYILAALALALLSCDSHGGWGPSNCGPVGPLLSGQVTTWQWKLNPGRDDQIDLYRNGQSVGSFFTDEGKYFVYNGGQWGQATSPPVAIPGHLLSQAQDRAKFFFGVQQEKLDLTEKFTRNGRSISYREAIQSLLGNAKDGLHDDSNKKHLTFIGKDASKAEFYRGLVNTGQGANPWKDYRIQVYDASRKIDREMLTPFRLENDQQFQQTGGVVYFQECDKNGCGKVLAAFYGDASVEEMKEGLRKVDPNFDPNRNPNPNKPKKPGPDGGGASSSKPIDLAPFLALGGLAAGAGVFYRKD